MDWFGRWVFRPFWLFVFALLPDGWICAWERLLWRFVYARMSKPRRVRWGSVVGSCLGAFVAPEALLMRGWTLDELLRDKRRQFFDRRV